MGSFQTFTTVLSLCTCKRAAGIKGAKPKPGQEGAAGGHFSGVIRYSLGRLTSLSNDLDQLHDLQTKTSTLSTNSVTFCPTVTLSHAKATESIQPPLNVSLAASLQPFAKIRKGHFISQ